jgi:hypothetical protein
MKRYIFILLLFTSIHGFSQLLENKSNLYLTYQNGHILGAEKFNNNGIIAPSYFSNFEHANGFSIKNTFKVFPYFSAGFSVALMDIKGWHNDEFIGYENSTLTTYDIKPIIQFHNRFQSSGLFNRLKIYGELSPNIGVSKLFIVNNMVEITGAENTIEDGIKSIKPYYGVQAGIGSEYALSNKFGISFDISIQRNFITHSLFIDNKYTLFGVNIGVFFNLAKFKRFKY